MQSTPTHRQETGDPHHFYMVNKVAHGRVHTYHFSVQPSVEWFHCVEVKTNGSDGYQYNLVYVTSRVLSGSPRLI
jgi:hypothetical protein